MKSLSRRTLARLLSLVVVAALSLSGSVLASSGYGRSLLSTASGDLIVPAHQPSQGRMQSLAVVARDGTLRGRFELGEDFRGAMALAAGDPKAETLWILEYDDSDGDSENEEVEAVLRLRRRDRTGNLVQEIDLGPPGGSVPLIAPDGKWAVLLSSPDDGETYVHERLDLATGERTPLAKAEEAVAGEMMLPGWNGEMFAMNGRALARGHGDPGKKVTVRKLDAKGKETATFELAAGTSFFQPLRGGGVLSAFTTGEGKSKNVTVRRFDADGSMALEHQVTDAPASAGGASEDGSVIAFTHFDGFLRIVDIGTGKESRISVFLPREGESWEGAQRRAVAALESSTSTKPGALLDAVASLSGPPEEAATQKLLDLGSAAVLPELLPRLAAEADSFDALYTVILDEDPEAVSAATISWIAAGNGFPRTWLDRVATAHDGPSATIEKAANDALENGDGSVASLFRRDDYRLGRAAILATLEYMGGERFDPSACSPFLGVDRLLADSLATIEEVVADERSPLRPRALLLLEKSQLERAGPGRDATAASLRRIAAGNDAKLAAAAGAVLDAAGLPLDEKAFLARLAADPERSDELAGYLVATMRRDAKRRGELLPYVHALADAAYGEVGALALGTLAEAKIAEVDEVLIPRLADPFLEAGMREQLFPLIGRAGDAQRSTLWAAYEIADEVDEDEGWLAYSILDRLLTLGDSRALRELRQRLVQPREEREADEEEEGNDETLLWWTLAIEHADPTMRDLARARLAAPALGPMDRVAALSLLVVTGPQRRDRKLLVNQRGNASLAPLADLGLARLGDEEALRRAVAAMAENRVPGLLGGSSPGYLRVIEDLRRPATPLLLAQARENADADLALWSLHALGAAEVPEIVRARLPLVDLTSSQEFLRLALEYDIDLVPALAATAAKGRGERRTALALATWSAHKYTAQRAALDRHATGSSETTGFAKRALRQLRSRNDWELDEPQSQGDADEDELNWVSMFAADPDAFMDAGVMVE